MDELGLHVSDGYICLLRQRDAERAARKKAEAERDEMHRQRDAIAERADKRQEALDKALDAAEAENAALKAFVDKLPKTKDGVPVYHGMEVWYPGEHESEVVEIHAAGESGYDAVGSCYSTKKAAEQAKGGKT
jgi:hypothetical protein